MAFISQDRNWSLFSEIIEVTENFIGIVGYEITGITEISLFPCCPRRPPFFFFGYINCLANFPLLFCLWATITLGIGFGKVDFWALEQTSEAGMAYHRQKQPELYGYICTLD